MPLFILTINMVIDCMDYGEWKFKKRGEEFIAVLVGFAVKLVQELEPGWLVLS